MLRALLARFGRGGRRTKRVLKDYFLSCTVKKGRRREGRTGCKRVKARGTMSTGLPGTCRSIRYLQHITGFPIPIRASLAASTVVRPAFLHVPEAQHHRCPLSLAPSLPPGSSPRAKAVTVLLDRLDSCASFSSHRARRQAITMLQIFQNG